jgi:hypothetical protein
MRSFLIKSHLKKQNALLKEQERQISELKESVDYGPEIKSPRPQHFRSRAKWNHEDDFLVKYLSKEPSKRYSKHNFLIS